jgi:FMN phosphatase YigB (HAD superfamily)
MSELQAVLFDLGDTLVDLGEGCGSYEARLLARIGRVYDALAAAGVALPDRASFCQLGLFHCVAGALPGN